MAIFWNDGTELYHYGILGQKWGVRRYQNPDGTLTEEGKRRYGKEYSNKLKKSGYKPTKTSAYKDAAKKLGKQMQALDNKYKDKTVPSSEINKMKVSQEKQLRELVYKEAFKKLRSYGVEDNKADAGARYYASKIENISLFAPVLNEYDKNLNVRITNNRY